MDPSRPCIFFSSGTFLFLIIVNSIRTFYLSPDSLIVSREALMNLDWKNLYKAS